ncbi:MAG: hypothetical protein NTW41_01610 [Verrucomicrobia bacterium]|nr:hypothetical protein [Verrucomicrobiota bacterium]
MILELLEWAVTPCPWFARRNGLLAAQIGIRHRVKRCRATWNGHLEACRKFVADAVGSRTADENLVILGSGHLNDFDLAFLQRRFQKITLVDALHPIEIQIQASLSRGRLRLITTDLSSPTAEIEDLVSRSSWTISSCLLSQLPLFSNEDSPALFDRHLALLQKSPRAVLISDVAKRLGSAPWESLIENHPLPHPAAEWSWLISPPGESVPDPEERLVQACLMHSDPSDS